MVNNNERILFFKLPFPSPLLPRSSVISEIRNDHVSEDGKKLTLIIWRVVTHTSMPEDKNEVRMKNFVADFYEELEVGENPLTRWTSLSISRGGDLHWILKPLGFKKHKEIFERKVETHATQWDADDSNEQLIYEMEEENARKLDIGNTLLKVFDGSKMYLIFVVLMILSQVFSLQVDSIIDTYYEELWKNVTACVFNPENVTAV